MANPSGMRVSTKERGSPASASGGKASRWNPRGGSARTRRDRMSRSAAGVVIAEAGRVVTRARREEVGRSDSRANDAGAGSRAGGDTSDSARATEEPGGSRGPGSPDVGRGGAPKSVAASPTPAIGPSLVARATDTATGTTPDESANRHHVAGPRSPDDARCAPPVPRRGLSGSPRGSRKIHRAAFLASSNTTRLSRACVRRLVRVTLCARKSQAPRLLQQTGCCCVLVMVGRVRRYSEKS